MTILEGRGLLDRAVETLPSAAALVERVARNEPLTRAELGVLLAYAKIVLFSEIVASDVPDDPHFNRDLMAYFPDRMEKKYSHRHPGPPAAPRNHLARPVQRRDQSRRTGLRHQAAGSHRAHPTRSGARLCRGARRLRPRRSLRRSRCAGQQDRRSVAARPLWLGLAAYQSRQCLGSEERRRHVSAWRPDRGATRRSPCAAAKDRRAFASGDARAHQGAA